MVAANVSWHPCECWIFSLYMLIHLSIGPVVGEMVECEWELDTEEEMNEDKREMGGNQQETRKGMKRGLTTRCCGVSNRPSKVTLGNTKETNEGSAGMNGQLELRRISRWKVTKRVANPLSDFPFVGMLTVSIFASFSFQYQCVSPPISFHPCLFHPLLI